MKIAYTHDTPSDGATVAAVHRSLSRLGFEVTPIEVGHARREAARRLLDLRPALVFNTVSGEAGEFPALLAALGLPHTGPAAAAAPVACDRHLGRLVAWAQGVATPRWRLIDRAEAVGSHGLRYPLRVSPRFGALLLVGEVVDSAAALARALEAHPAGLLVSERSEGELLVVSLVGAAGDDGILCPPAASTARGARALARRVIELLGLRDAAEIGLWAARSGQLTFLAAQAFPSLDPVGGLCEAARVAGLGGIDEVVASAVESAASRCGLPARGPGAGAPGLRVGLTFNVKRIDPKSSGGDDSEAEFDGPQTIAAIEAAIGALGHEVVLLEATRDLPRALAESGVEVVFNIAEGQRGRNREAQVPALLEFSGVEYTGSDPMTLSLSLDKGLAKRLVREAGVPTASFFTMKTGEEPLPEGLVYPLVVKPLAEGSSKGVLGSSAAENEDELRALARAITLRYGQEAIVEEYLDGREFTVALLGERGERVLPPMEIVFLNPEVRRKIYTFEHKQAWSTDIRYDMPARVDPALGEELAWAARESFRALGCRDVARVDLRQGRDGRVHFIECNPLPGLSPGWSDLCLIATGVGLSYEALLGEILAPALARHKRRAADRAAGRASSPPPPR